MTLTPASFSLAREVVIHALPATVFAFFTDSARFARWWGEGSRVDPRVGGAVEIRYPNGIVARGEVLEIEPERRFAFSYGYESGQPFGPGATRVVLELSPHPEGTQLILHHELASEQARDHHDQGWRYQLAVFAFVAADDAAAGLADRIDDWFRAWNADDADGCRAALRACAIAEVAFRDRYGCTVGIDDLCAHVAAIHQHMPGLTLRPSAEARHAHGTALVDWEACDGEGTVRMRGTNVCRLAADGRIAEVIGIA